MSSVGAFGVVVGVGRFCFVVGCGFDSYGILFHPHFSVPSALGRSVILSLRIRSADFSFLSIHQHLFRGELSL